MTTQPEALRLAEWIESDMSCHGDAEIAAELRRLSAVEAELLAMRRVFSEAGCTFDVNYIRRLVRAEAQRDVLLAVVNKLEYSSDGYIKRYPEESEVSAAIKAVEENI